MEASPKKRDSSAGLAGLLASNKTLEDRLVIALSDHERRELALEAAVRRAEAAESAQAAAEAELGEARREATRVREQMEVGTSCTHGYEYDYGSRS